MEQEVPVRPLLTEAEAEAARLLAVCPRTVWSLADSGLLPRIKIGRSIRYDPKDITAFVEKSKQPTQVAKLTVMSSRLRKAKSISVNVAG